MWRTGHNQLSALKPLFGLQCPFCFFFQAEDGIRDYKVTGVQTCALPISAVYLGSLFSSTVEDLLGVLTALGQWGLLLLGVALGLFIVRKWWQRHRMVRSLRMPRMSVRELAGPHAQGMEPTVIDVRALPQYPQGHIPGEIGRAHV